MIGRIAVKIGFLGYKLSAWHPGVVPGLSDQLGSLVNNKAGLACPGVISLPRWGSDLWRVGLRGWMC